MSTCLIFLLFCNILTLITADEIVHSAPKGFGKYFLLITKLEKCNSTYPIAKNLFNAYNLKLLETESQYQKVAANLEVVEDFQLTEILYEASVWKNGAYRKMMSKVVENPCNVEYLQKLINMLSECQKNCVIKMNNYTSIINDPNDIAHKLFGNIFFYAKYKIKIEFNSNKGATFCLYSYSEIKPLNSSRKLNKKQ